jgi:hypothetical protein
MANDENETPTITVDMDKECTECGKAGAGKNGMCLHCTLKKALPGTAIMADSNLVIKSIAVSEREINGLLREHAVMIFRSLGSGYNYHCESIRAGTVSESKKFEYSVSLGLKLIPFDGDMKVRATIAYGTRRSDESESVIVSTQPELDFEGSDTDETS